jgi:8-oxo-dGTP pyrophosphatase MutT (NUDIX family)
MSKGALTANFPAVYMLVEEDRKLLFVLRTNTGFMDGFYSLPAGRVEPAEAFRAAAIREANEEVGVVVAPEDARQVYIQQRYSDAETIWVDVFFKAEKWSGTPSNAEPEAHGEIAWFDIGNLPEDKIMDYQLAGIQAMARGETYGELNWPAASAPDAVK